MADKPTLDLTRYIPALLTFTSNKLSHGASDTYRRLFGIGISEWRVMATLAVEPGIPASRICQVIGFDKALASRVVQKLAAQGLVNVTQDSQNSSRTLNSLTPAGLRLHDKVLEVVRKREKILHAAFTKDEINTLVELLQRVYVQADIVNLYDPAEEARRPVRPSASSRQNEPRAKLRKTPNTNRAT